MVDETSPLLANGATDRPSRTYISNENDTSRVDENGISEESLQAVKPVVNLAAVVSSDHIFCIVVDGVVKSERVVTQITAPAKRLIYISLLVF